MKYPWKVLLVEDSEEDAELLQHHLAKSGPPFALQRIELLAQFNEALEDRSWDAIICDYNLGSFTAFDALAVAQQQGCDVPFIVLSTVVPEDVGASLLRAGAHDIVMKSRMARLVPALEREIVNAELRKKNRELEKQIFHAQRMESIGAITSGVAHDLNNILAPILMASDLVDEGSLNVETARLFKIVQTNARRGAEVVKQLLSLARKIDGKRTVLDMKHLVQDIARLAKQTFPQSIRVKLDTAQELWKTAGDATQVYQVLLNLAVNARDAMPNGGTLCVSAENTPIDESFASMAPEAVPGPYVRVSVSDTGTGIAPDVLPKIFDPFFSTKNEAGTGLGLSTVLGIVNNHGGFVLVNSSLGEGTRFDVYFPASQDSHLSSEHSTSALQHQGNGELVLVAEDERDVREVLGKLLTMHQYTVLLASDGPEALVQLSRHLADVQLLITDIHLPFMDGVALIRAVRRMSPTIRIIASSGSEGREQELHELAVSAVLRKPYAAGVLLETVYQVLTGVTGGIELSLALRG